MKKLSVVIITYNEEANIGACIDGVQAIADEILILDSYSTDNTEQICHARGVRFEQHKFDGHIQQKNRAKDLATFDWVLSLDADEKPDSTLLNNILQLKNDDFGSAGGYAMNRLNFYCGKPVKTCGWYPDVKLRLWNRTKGAWTGTNPHDRFELFHSEKVIHLNGDILHNTYPTHESMLKQVDRFAKIGAEQYRNKPILWLFMKIVFSVPFKFLRNYFFKAGIKDGRAGLLICFHQMREVYLKYSGALKLKLNSSTI